MVIDGDLTTDPAGRSSRHSAFPATTRTSARRPVTTANGSWLAFSSKTRNTATTCLVSLSAPLRSPGLPWRPPVDLLGGVFGKCGGTVAPGTGTLRVLAPDRWAADKLTLGKSTLGKSTLGKSTLGKSTLCDPLPAT